ncbi:LysR family transcriptional regulator [Rugosimonospora acidiphila]|uniref:LysR family transcriptional regulator n=1 Tax=Rugosimonospora acidiphila TaxID=556531 RepID=A0ABP9SFX1_9ACTN
MAERHHLAPTELLALDPLALGLFVDAVDLGSLSAAARRHRISQPSASQAIGRLERRLGVSLLRRGPRGSRPSPEGERLAGPAREVLAALNRFAAQADAVRAGARGRIRVAASYTNAEYVLPARVVGFGAVRPDVAVRLTVANTDEVVAAVRAGEVELGFVEAPGTFAGLRTRRIGRDELAVVVAPDHPWAGRDDLPGNVLARTPLLLRERESGTRRTYEEAAARAGYRVAEPYGVMTSTAALKAAVRAGLGATVVSRLAVQDELRDGSLVTVPVSGLDLGRDLRAVWLPGQHGRLAAEFIRHVVGHPDGG